MEAVLKLSVIYKIKINNNTTTIATCRQEYI